MSAHPENIKVTGEAALEGIRNLIAEKGVTLPTIYKTADTSRKWEPSSKQHKYIGWWGRTKVGKDNFFWVFGAYGFKGDWENPPIYEYNFRREGFAPSLEEAEQAAIAAIIELFPVGASVLFSASHAAEHYKRTHAKTTRFAEGWRDKFPFWSNLTHLHTWGYHYDDDRTWHHKHLIVSVTEKAVFVTKGENTELSVDRIQRRDCIQLDRKELESTGAVWSSSHRDRFHVRTAI